MPHVLVPGSWRNVSNGRARFDLAADTLDELLRAFVNVCPDAGYRLYSPAGELLRYHLFFVDGEQIERATPADEVQLEPESVIKIIPPLSGG